MSQAPWRGVIIRIAVDRGVIGPEASRYLAGALRRVHRDHTRDGINMPANLRELLTELEAIAASGHADVRSPAAAAVWPLDDEIGTEEAAQMLGTSREHANRLARSGVLGPTRKVHNRRLVGRSHVALFIADRDRTTT